MCGIAGIYTKNQKVNAQKLKRMIDVLTHRGPDNKGYFLENNLGLGHARLSIIDLTEKANQPLYSEDKNIVLVANGEIYNFIELKAELIKKGVKFKTNSDCEPIIYCYKEYGLEFVKKLYGMFAFALFDRKKNQLILARDRLGIKPLYYLYSPHNFFIFASEIKAILEALDIIPPLNEKAIVHFFLNQFYSGRSTIFKDIKKVMPGEIIVVNKNLNLTSNYYWSALDIKPKNVSFEEAKEEFDFLFPSVVDQHLRSDVPYGLFLSGGMDSGTILSTITRLQDKKIHTFTIGYKDVSMKDELEDARYIANKFNVYHEPIMVDKDTLFKRIPYAIWCIDDLMRDYAFIPTSILSEKASEHLKVVLTGEGGDEVFAGYGRYCGWLKRAIKSAFFQGGGFRNKPSISIKLLKKIFKPELNKVLDSYKEIFIEKWKECNRKWTTLMKYQYIDLTTALVDNLLLKVDRATMGFSLEARVPFLDHRIVEFGLSLPDKLKTKGRKGKIFLRKWAESYIPAHYLNREKRGFRVPVGEWFTEKFLKALCEKLKNSKGIREWFYVNRLNDLFNSEKNHKYRNRCIWCLMQFGIWFYIFIENRGKKPSYVEDPLAWIN